MTCIPVPLVTNIQYHEVRPGTEDALNAIRRIVGLPRDIDVRDIGQ